jgi:hypothetical protein
VDGTDDGRDVPVTRGRPAGESGRTPLDGAADFARGVESGLDPQPVADAVTTGYAVTSPSSRWNHRRCRTCGQTFRRGDQVLLSEHGRVVQHADPWLRCAPPQATAGPSAGGGPAEAGGGPAEAGSGDDASAFAAGLVRAFPVAGGIRALRLAGDDWRVARPRSATAPTCLYCGHTFRAGEHIVVCPCRPLDAHCGAAVHRDPAAGLNCWEAWRPDSELTVCPVTLRRVDPRTAQTRAAPVQAAPQPPPQPPPPPPPPPQPPAPAPARHG